MTFVHFTIIRQERRKSTLVDENHETGQIQAKGPSEEGRRPKWRRTKPPSGEG